MAKDSKEDPKFFVLDREHAEIEFNKSIAGCYRDGNAEYDEVGVLLLTWRDDDMSCKEKEVNELEDVFRDKFNYHTEQFEIPSTDSEVSLFNRVDAFVKVFDTRSKLGIIYYGGHGEKVESFNGSDLQLFAKTSSTKPLSQTNTFGDFSVRDIAESPTDVAPPPLQPRISFLKICEHLRPLETDILLIVDSCFAAGAFTDQPFGGRKCELFCSIAEKDYARAPGQEGSFTKILTSSLTGLISEQPQGFTTTDLYRQIYRKQHLAHKPYLFNQSRLDFGKIWLRPWRPKDEVLDIAETKYTIDVRFHLTKSLSMPELNTVAKALQWIPFVQLVRMQKMSSPAHELSDFIWRVNMAKILRPMLTRARRRRELTQALQLRGTASVPGSAPPSPVARTTSLEFLKKEPRDVELFDWSNAELFDSSEAGLASKHEDHVSDDPEATAQPTEAQRKLVNETYSGIPEEPESINKQGQDPKKPSESPDFSASAPRPIQKDAALLVPEESVQHASGPRLSQRALDGVMFFTLGLLAPTLVRWAIHGCASPFAGSC
ncbi:hypothetical protein K491DRAFT_634032 [Lophiostoma macrostomum CBS 122681]|uniref:Uncharacterized protein n=1 Tax=Lophiostoma macrostomum CBS 122681 TaxID=1314788 RepID=A0A6A6T1Y1_9PLEO|nr:hypothetical protein K491DRAFT_634032 [Lophiostoma macrostomum CBS 122681]